MKTSTYLKTTARGLAVLLAAVLLSAGCAMPAGNSATGAEGVTFTLGASAQRATGASGSSGQGSIAALIVSIEKMDGTSVYDMKRLSLVNLNGSYISEKLPLAIGQFKLTAFFVVDSANNAIFATPLEGSPLANEVQDPLPIEFNVQQGLITAIVPQVVAADAQAPEKFGYTSFQFQIVGGAYPSLSIGRRYAPGADGLCFTADDVMGGYYLKDFKRYGETNMEKDFYDAGTDGLWLTNDDVPSYWWWGRYDFGGSSQDNAGPDGIWFTIDDHSPEWNNWDKPGLPDTEVLYNNSGPDGLMFTADDVISGYYKSTFDAQGNPTLRVHYSGPGPDSIWFNGDDELGPCWFGIYFKRDYSGVGNFYDSWDREIRYQGPGPDNVWFNADDEIRSVIKHEFGEGGKYFTKEINYGPGPDGQYLTADDVPVSYFSVENQY